MTGIASIHAPAGAAPALANPAFERVWARTEQPVKSGDLSRSWFWGPEPLTGGLYERYFDSPGDERRVQYFDKGRMEINDPAADSASDWYVTSGLLTRELVSGRFQVGNNTFLDTGTGAGIPVAGDPDNTFPSYGDLQRVVDQGKPDRTGGHATAVLLPGSESVRAAAVSDPNAQFVHYVSYPGPMGSMVGYNLPRAFWTFMTQAGEISQNGERRVADPLFDWVFVLGYPISDPFWVEVRVAGIERWVLVQPFERRVLTYTPGNAPGWQVEMGNIGLHYFRWRYRDNLMAALDGDRDFFALNEGDQWVFSTTEGVDEYWLVTGESRSFSGGSTLIRRLEQRGGLQRNTYWSVTNQGLDLYGFDELDGSGNVVNTTVYWPPVHYFPGSAPYIGQAWSTSTTVISTNGSPLQRSVSIQIASWQRVSTPAGLFDAWKLQITEWDASDSTDPRRRTTTLWLTPGIGTVQWLNDGFAAQLKAGTTYETAGDHTGGPTGP